MTSVTSSRPTGLVDYFFSFARQTNDIEKANLDRDIVYELIRGHGRTDMYLFYATVIGDFERVVEHWILEEEWVKTIDVISRQVCVLVFNCHFASSMFVLSRISKCIIASVLSSCAMPPKKLSICG